MIMLKVVRSMIGDADGRKRVRGAALGMNLLALSGIGFTNQLWYRLSFDNTLDQFKGQYSSSEECHKNCCWLISGVSFSPARLYTSSIVCHSLQAPS